MVADTEELGNLDTSEIHARRLNAKEVLMPKKRWTCSYSRSQMEQSSCLEEIRSSEEPPPSRITLQEAKSITKIFKESRTGPQPLDTLTDDSETRNDFWTIAGNYVHRHHVEPRGKLHVPSEASFPIPLQYIDVVKRTSTTLDVLLESRIDDYWSGDGGRDPSVTWTSFTQFTILNEKPPDG